MQLLRAVDFQYDTNAVSREAFEDHMKLYKGYVDKFNQTTGELKNAPQGDNPTYSEYRGLKLGQGYSLASIVLHELYFGGQKARPASPDNLTTSVLAAGFGSFDGWVKDFRSCAASARGWGVLAYSPRSKDLVHMMLDSHDDGMVSGTYPVIAIDMYEHSYFKDYGTNRDAYISNFLASIDWIGVAKRLSEVAKIVEKANQQQPTTNA